ncbi:excinuclease ABC subunit UvrC [Patescibacteria group bacterium]|nr:excinuclease ABC subunit UvrC [Patescibacteria group bacterium]
MNKIKNLLRKLPTSPGIYQFLDSAGEILYIGKAKNLKNRVKSYFQKIPKTPKIERLLEKTEDLKWLETNSEVEALTLEANLVKEFQPKFNALLRDDKHFLYFKITNEDFPRILTVRKIEKDGAKYFGPKTDSKAVRAAVKLIQKLFKIRICNLGILAKNGGAEVAKKTVKYPCIYSHINLCAAPCLGKVSRENYAKEVSETVDFLAGDTSKIIQKLREKMQQAASEKKFELASQLRDKILAIENSFARQLASAPDLASRDVVGVKLTPQISGGLTSKAYFALLSIRNGKLIDAKNFVMKSGESEFPEILASFLTQYFSISSDFPAEILLPEKIENVEILEKWLNEKTSKKMESSSSVSDTLRGSASAGRRWVKILFPQRGDKSGLLRLAEKNAAAFAVQAKAKFENATERTIGAAAELARNLGIKKELKRIEAYDISHFAGDATAGSMVVFERGEPKNSDYRHFKVRSLARGKVDDCKSLAEILARRMEYLIPQNSEIRIRKATGKQLLEIEEFSKIKKKRNTECFVALAEKKIVGGFDLISHDKKHVEFIPLFSRERNLEEIFLKSALQKTSGKLYFSGNPTLAEKFSFREARKIPDFLKSKKNIWVREKKSEMDSSFSAKPNLVILDGGKGQLATVSKNVKFPKGVEVVGLAKREEEIFKIVDGKFEQILLPANSQALFLVQRIRDEAHRFANSLREKLQDPVSLAKKGKIGR